jgi:hypothetical protein
MTGKWYLFSYRHDGATWGFEVWASSPEDARAKVSKMAYATYDGVLVAKVPSVVGPLVKFGLWARNMISGLWPRAPR